MSDCAEITTEEFPEWHALATQARAEVDGPKIEWRDLDAYLGECCIGWVMEFRTFARAHPLLDVSEPGSVPGHPQAVRCDTVAEAKGVIEAKYHRWLSATGLNGCTAL